MSTLTINRISVPKTYRNKRIYQGNVLVSGGSSGGSGGGSIQVQADWNLASGLGSILNKPDLSFWWAKSENVQAEKAIYLKSTSHPDYYWLSNYWDGQYWQLVSNHNAGVNVAHATDASNLNGRSDYWYPGNFNPDLKSDKDYTTFAGVKDGINFNDLIDRSFVGSIDSVGGSPFGDSWYTVYNARHRNGIGDGTVWGSQIAIGMTAYQNRIAFRSHYSGSWQGWNELWHTGNLNKPLATGGYINSTGQADAHRNGSIFAYAAAGVPANGSMITFGGFDAGSYPTQIIGDYTNGNALYFRTLNEDNGGGWNPWRNVWHDGNLNRSDTDFTANKVHINGGTGGGISFPDNAYGGGGDSAGIRLISRGGESISLELYVTNDADDWINFSTPDNNAVKVNGNTVWNGGNLNRTDTDFYAREIYSNGWFRSYNNATGWYNEANAAGIYSDGYQRVRLYNNSALIVDNNILSTNGGYRSSDFHGLAGDYNLNGTSSKIIWTIGDNWNTLGTMYGLGYEYSSFGTGILNHQMVLREGGNTTTRLGLSGEAYFHGILKANNNIESTSFSPETNFLGANGSGFQITNNGGIYTLEIDNIKIRKSLLANEIVINKVRASNGSFWVNDSAKVKSGIIYDGNYYIRWEDDLVFQVGDIIYAQAFSSSGLYYYVYRVTYTGSDSTSAYTYIVNENGTQPTQIDLTGKEFVRRANPYNTARQGALYLTSSDSNSPYLEVLDGMTSSTISDANRMVRLGKLDGITSANFGTLTGYGLWTKNGYFEGKISSNSGWIAGWIIDSNSLSSGANGQRISLFSDTSTLKVVGSTETSVLTISVTNSLFPEIWMYYHGSYNFYGNYGPFYATLVANENRYMTMTVDSGNPTLALHYDLYAATITSNSIDLSYSGYTNHFKVRTDTSNLEVTLAGLPEASGIPGDRLLYLSSNKINSSTQFRVQGTGQTLAIINPDGSNLAVTLRNLPNRTGASGTWAYLIVNYTTGEVGYTTQG